MTEFMAIRANNGAIFISDVEPSDELRVTIARDVLAGATHLLNDAGVSPREVTFAARELARCLAEILDIFAPDDDADERRCT